MNEANALLREAIDALDPVKAAGLRERIGLYLDGQRTVDTSTVADDLLSVNSGANGHAIDQAMRRVKDIGKPPKNGG